jgi:putative ABC transport system permease protein
MLKNYLKTAWRNLLRNRTLSLINLTGLSISVAFCALLFFHIRYEQSFDRFHEKKDRLFRVEATNFWGDPNGKAQQSIFAGLTRSEDEDNDLEFPLVVGRDMQYALPEVRSVTRFEDISRHNGQPLVRANGQVYKEEHALYAEANFFQNFSFPLLKGNKATVLTQPGNVVLAEATAKKYFGNADPVGKTIELVTDSNRLFRVAGVVADASANSSLKFSFVLPLEADGNYQRDIAEKFNRNHHFLIVELQSGVDAAVFEGKLNGWMRSYYLPSVATDYGLKPEVAKRFGFFLRPFADGHFNVSQGWGHYTDMKSIYQLVCIVGIILLLASLNYVLITVSNAASRSQEIGVRKVMGAGRGNVILQFWMETQLLVAAAVIIGMALALLGVPLLRVTIGSGVEYGSIRWVEVLEAGLVLAIILGLLAGYYPAMLISKLKPVTILKSFSAFRIRPRFSRVLVVVQFTCCVVLMMAALVIDRQMEYVQHKDLGFDKDQVLMVQNPTYDYDFTQRVRSQLYAFARTQPSILAYSALTGGLTGEANMNGFSLNGQRMVMRQISVDYDYFSLLGLKLVEGRLFSPQYAMDTARKVRAYVVNETMWKLLGKQAQLNVFNDSIYGTIVGVVPDYHLDRLNVKIQPEVHELAKRYMGTFLFKIKAGQTQTAIAALESQWKKATNNYPFTYTFLDQSIAQLYEADMRWRKAVQASCGFAILIACMGLFGLAAITAANRTREVGIRKVLGASVGELAGLLSRGFLGMVGLSFLIAVPLSWWLMNRWLEDFAYRIQISWWMFGVVGLVALGVALATVGFQVLKAARANPVDALRSE